MEFEIQPKSNIQIKIGFWNSLMLINLKFILIQQRMQKHSKSKSEFDFAIFLMLFNFKVRTHSIKNAKATVAIKCALILNFLHIK